MPLTELRDVEWQRVAEIMSYKLGDAKIWEHYTSLTTELLTTNELEALKRAELEVYGSVTARVAIANHFVSQELQADIDSKVKAFIWKHRLMYESDKIPI